MKIWIATGGTGGHVFPALAVAQELTERGHRVIISSDCRTMQMVKRDKPSDARVAFIWASGVGGRGKIRQSIALCKIGISALLLWLRFMVSRPARVVAFGGYASVPAVLAAHLWKIPTLLHEQNAAIGRANTFALRWVRTLMTSFPKVSGIPQNKLLKVIYTGLPVRKDFLVLSNKPLSGNMHLFVTGGSLGAQILDDVVPLAVADLQNKKIFITHQTRPENVVRLQKFYADRKIRANVLSFVHDMAGVIADSDLIIGRSGASTVGELQTIGRPAILIPLGINPDQAANAENFANSGAGFAIPQNKFSQKWLTATLKDLFNNPLRLTKMAEKAYVPNDAVRLIADQICG